MLITTIRRISILMFFLLACAAGNLRAEPLVYLNSLEVESGLKTGGLAEGFLFYFSGSQAEPHTIIGVRRGVVFDQSLWQKTGSTASELQSWYDFIDNPHRDVRDRYFGGFITDETSGEVVGLWYSKHRFRTATINEKGALHIGRPVVNKKRPRLGRFPQ